MKKLRKLLAGFMMLAMVISLLPMLAPITAYGDTTVSTIDTSELGSLTIHKYEYNGDLGVAGTGAVGDLTGEGLIGENGRIPIGDTGDDAEDNAIPLAGVTFRITLVDTLENYYKYNGNALPTVASLTGNTGTYVDTYYENDNNKVTDVANLSEGKWMVLSETIADGTTTILDLPLGIYLVQEIDAPDQITGYTPDFLVSIPMTTVDGDNWLYDVHVYPKNRSAYGEVTLLKKGQIGTDSSSPLQNATFELQHKVAEGEWNTITTNNKGGEIGENGTLTTGEDGKISVSDLAPGNYRFVETSTPDGYIMDGNTTYEFEIKADGKVYLNNADTPTDTATNPITVTNYKPNVDKQVKNRDNTWGDNADYGKGTAAENEIPYKIKVDVPQNINELRNFTLTDTMTNQTLVANTFKICSDEACETEILSGSYTKPAGGASTWSVAFNVTNNGSIESLLEVYAGQSIYIYFEAVLTVNAVTTSAGNPNDVQLEYSNQILPESDTDGNPNDTDDPNDPDDDPKDDIIKDQVVVYTFQFAIEKQDAENASEKLAGVKFDLYQWFPENTDDDSLSPSTTVEGFPAGKYRLICDDYATNGNGVINFIGLSNGKYYLVETKAADGYNLLKAPHEVNITATYTTNSATTITTTSGVTTTSTTVTNETYNAGTDGLVQTVTIKNSKGFTLPTTGGVGTYIFIFVGVSMMAAAVILFFVTKKKDVKKSI